MASLSIPNTFADGNIVYAAGHNQNNSAIANYVNDLNSGASAWERVLATNSTSVPGVFNNGAGTNDILNAQDNGTNVFRVADNGNIILGSGALSTSATDGFLYMTGGAGIPSGTPTTFTGRTPLYVDQTNNRLYFYANSAWQNASNNPGVDDSTIEISSNQLRVKNGLTIQTLNIGTALQYQTFASLPILQVVQGTTATSASNGTSSFADSNLSVSITPKLSSSKILVFANGKAETSAGNSGYLTIARGTTNLSSTGNGFSILAPSSNDHVAMFYYDSPATTSATTYVVRIRTDGAGSCLFPVSSGTPAAVIIAVEVAQ